MTMKMIIMTTQLSKICVYLASQKSSEYWHVRNCRNAIVMAEICCRLWRRLPNGRCIFGTTNTYWAWSAKTSPKFCR